MSILRTDDQDAFWGGVAIMGFLLASALFVDENVAAINIRSFYSHFLLAAFVGLAGGHYLGLALDEDSDPSVWFAIGLLSTLAAAIAYITYSNAYNVLLPFIMAAGAIGLTLLHSAVIDDSEEIANWVTLLGKTIPVFGTIAIGLYYIVTPILQTTAGFTNELYLAGIAVGIALLIVLVNEILSRVM